MIVHIWDRNHIILELDESGTVVERYQRGRNGHLISSDNHGFYLFNARGDVVQRVDSDSSGSGDGNGDSNNNIHILHVYMYDAFGNELNPNPNPNPNPENTTTNTNPFRFAGEYFDIETGTYYLRARHYNPRTGRFTQPDPHWNIHNMQSDAASIIQSGNLYMYTMHNPVMWVDPNGTFVITASLALVATAVAAVASLALGVDYIAHGSSSLVGQAAQGIEQAADAIMHTIDGALEAVSTLLGSHMQNVNEATDRARANVAAGGVSSRDW